MESATIYSLRKRVNKQTVLIYRLNEVIRDLVKAGEDLAQCRQTGQEISTAKQAWFAAKEQVI